MSSVLHSSIYEIEWCRIFLSADKKEWLDGSIANVAQLRTVKIRNFSNHKKNEKKWWCSSLLAKAGIHELKNSSLEAVVCSWSLKQVLLKFL